MTTDQPSPSPSPSPAPSPPPGAGERREDIGRILTRLARLRGRIRAIFAAIGLSRWIVQVVGCLALYFVADRFLDLPLAVRRFVRLGLLHPPGGPSVFVVVPLALLAAFLAVALTRKHHAAAPFFAFVAGGLLGLFVYMGARLLMPLRVPLPTEALALSVESRFGVLRDRLAAALDFERELEAPTRGESTAMMAHVVHEAAEAARGVPFARAVTGRRALRWSGAALLVLVLAAGATAAMHDDVALWARRSLLLENVAWPRSTHMVAVDLTPDGAYVPHDAAQAYPVSIGHGLTVYAAAIGTLPHEAQVLDATLDGAGGGEAALARRMFRVPGSAGVFAYEFIDVRRPFSFVLRGGDDDDDIPRYRVEITIPPRVLTAQSRITFPTYLGREEESIADASVTVPEGAQVAVRFTTDLEIASAQVLLGSDVVAAQPVEGSQGRAFTFAYAADHSRSGRIVLVTPDGKRNDGAADTFEVRVRPDTPPRVDWMWPRSSVEVTPDGRLPLLARSDDDHGVTALTLEMRTGAAEPRRVELHPWKARTGDPAPEEPFPEDPAPKDPSPKDPSPKDPSPKDPSPKDRAPEHAEVPTAVNDGALGRKRILTYAPIEIAALRGEDGKALAPGSGVEFRLVALDSRGQKRESEWVRVDVSAPSTLSRDLALQRSNVRTALEAVRREQAARIADVKTLAGAPVGAAERDLLKSVRFAQGKVAQDADRAVRELVSVFNAFVYDRLGTKNPNAKILGFLDRHHRRTYGLQPIPEAARPRTSGKRAARTDWRGDPVFPYALYDEVVAAWRAKVIYDNGLLNKMCAVLADAVDISARLAPAAHRAAAAASIEAGATELGALRSAQDANLAALDRLLEAMKSWQSLDEVTKWLRTVIEEQKGLVNEIESRQPGAEKRDVK